MYSYAGITSKVSGIGHIVCFCDFLRIACRSLDFLPHCSVCGQLALPQVPLVDGRLARGGDPIPRRAFDDRAPGRPSLGGVTPDPTSAVLPQFVVVIDATLECDLARVRGGVTRGVM